VGYRIDMLAYDSQEKVEARTYTHFQRNLCYECFIKLILPFLTDMMDVLDDNTVFESRL